MKIAEDLTFRRKYFVKDLLNANTLLGNTDILEFGSFMDFAQVFLRDKKFGLNSVDKLIVPVENPEEAELLLKIDPDVRPWLIIYLKDFSKATRDKFHEIKRTSLLCLEGQVPVLKSMMQEDPSQGFLEFMCHSYGYFRGEVNSSNVDDIPYIYSNAFFTLPYFCISDIKWDWESFETTQLKDLHAVVYNTSLVATNMLKRKSQINFEAFGLAKQTSWVYDYMHTLGCKRIFIQDGNMYIDDPGSGMSIDLYDDHYNDANNVPLVEVDSIRSAFDIKYSNAWGVQEPSIIRISQNIKCTGNPAMVPYLCSIVSRTLNGGRV